MLGNMKFSKIKVSVLLLISVVLIAVIPLFMNKESDFGGADGKAESTISEIQPSYKPWANSLIELPGGETESLLFCIQAALGAGIFGYGIGVLKERSRYQKIARANEVDTVAERKNETKIQQINNKKHSEEGKNQ